MSYAIGMANFGLHAKSQYSCRLTFVGLLLSSNTKCKYNKENKTKAHLSYRKVIIYVIMHSNAYLFTRQTSNLLDNRKSS